MLLDSRLVPAAPPAPVPTQEAAAVTTKVTTGLPGLNTRSPSRSALWSMEKVELVNLAHHSRHRRGPRSSCSTSAVILKDDSAAALVTGKHSKNGIVRFDTRVRNRRHRCAFQNCCAGMCGGAITSDTNHPPVAPSPTVSIQSTTSEKRCLHMRKCVAHTGTEGVTAERGA